MDEFPFFASNHRQAGRKARQLAAQVARTLSYVLGEVGDPVLARLDVLAVEPAPDTSQLLATVAFFPGAEPAPADDVLRRLRAAEGRLRAEVAASITRRRAPRLTFHLACLSSTGCSGVGSAENQPGKEADDESS